MIKKPMKYWATYLITIILLSVLLTLIMWLFMPDKDKAASITSPLPVFLTREKNKQVTLLDLWSPIIEVIEGRQRQPPQLTAKSVLIYDLTTNKTVFEKNAKERIPMASLTKIMTAIIALESGSDNAKYIVKPGHIVGENSMGIVAGEALTRRELLYGLILRSGNDAAEVLAGGFPGGREAFVQAMNDKAKALGLTDTHFTNPSGLQGDGEQYTTAYDLLVITRYAIDTFPEFTQITSTFEITLPATATHAEYFMQNETNLISSYPGVKGIKTGYTPEAGLCLVTYLDYGDHRIIAILLGSENRRQEMKDLLDYSLRRLGSDPPNHD